MPMQPLNEALNEDIRGAFDRVMLSRPDPPGRLLAAVFPTEVSPTSSSSESGTASSSSSVSAGSSSAD